MPILPLAPGDTDLRGGDLPVVDTTDIASELPSNIASAPVAPVRDALLAGFAEGFKSYQSVASYAAAQSDPGRATGDYLLDFAEERGVIPTADQTEDEIRAQLFATPEIVTPQAIMDAVNGILANYTLKTARFNELELDGWFVRSASVGGAWNSFVGSTPEYPDRYYDADPAYLPAGCVPWNSRARDFVLRIPALGLDPNQYAYVNAIADANGPFSGHMFLFQSNTLASDVYASIVRLVDRIKGQSMTWTLIVDTSI